MPLPVSAGWLARVLAAGLAAGSAAAQAPALVVRCPGPPVLYTSELTAEQARRAGCTALMDLPVATGAPVRGSRQPLSGRPTDAGSVPPAAGTTQPVGAPQSAPAPGLVAPRDILLAEVEREEQRQRSLQQRLSAAGVTAAEREELQRARARSEADLQAIRRELRRMEGAGR